MVTITVALMSLMCFVQVADTFTECGDQSNDELEVHCAGDTICYKDKYGNKGCAPEGYPNVPGAECKPERYIPITDTGVDEACDPWHPEKTCPSNSVCCLTQAGHKCVHGEQFKQIRQDSKVDVQP